MNSREYVSLPKANSLNVLSNGKIGFWEWGSSKGYLEVRLTSATSRREWQRDPKIAWAGAWENLKVKVIKRRKHWITLVKIITKWGRNWVNKIIFPVSVK